MAPGWCRWYPTSPTHWLTVAIQEGVDPEALLQGCRPPQRFRFSQSLLPNKRENRIVSLTLHARREQAEVSDVVPVAVGDVIGQDSQELAWRVGGLDYLFRARVLRHESDFLTVNLPEPVLRDRGAAGVAACIFEKLLLASEPV